MSDAIAALILGGLLLAVMGGGLTYAIIEWLKDRILLKFLRVGWFAILLALVLVAFLRNEPFSEVPWVMAAGLLLGACIFILREVAARYDLQFLLALDIGVGVLLFGVATFLVGPGASLPMTTIVPAMALAAAAFAAQMMMRYWRHNQNTEMAERARLTRVWTLLLIPVIVVLTLLIFGGLNATPYGA